MNRTDELEVMLTIARDAAQLVASVYATDFSVDYKGPADPVTDADRRANALLCTRLAHEFGPIPIVAEESDESAFAGWTGAPRALFVDPLDGTLEFVARNGDFVVMVGLAERGRPVAGVVVAPASGMAWIGAPGVGAFEIAANGERKAIRVSETKDLSAGRAVVSRSHPSGRLLRMLDALGFEQVIARGSAGLKAAEVASGRADVYLQPGHAGKRWDTCAPSAIVEAAGGHCTDALGTPIDYSGPELENTRGFLATNGHLHEHVLARTRRDQGA